MGRRTGRRTGPSSTPSSSTRATRRTSTWACRAVAFTSRWTRGGAGGPWCRGWRSSAASTPPTSPSTTRTACASPPPNPDRLYQQNHCGIYRLDRPGTEWVRVGKAMPRTVGDIGFPMVVHPRDPDTAWVFPMDGTTVWPRTSPGGRPAAYRTSDGGKTWRRLDGGLPEAGRLVDGEAPGHGGRRGRAGGALRGDDQRGALGEPRRGAPVLLRREAPPGDLRGRDGRTGAMKVLIPSPLHYYTGSGGGGGRGGDARRAAARPRPALPGPPLPHRGRAGPDAAARPLLRGRRAGLRPRAAARGRASRCRSSRR